ncbi:TPA: peptide ABC transporter substrate-binding protein, partial [Bacillus cereus]|nr:peptide ABC transporter substrate-binding protein [Bacillus cereus]
MLKKVMPIMAAVLGASFLLTACSSEKKENTANANDKDSKTQSIHLPYMAEIPTMDVSKATDGDSMNVMKNVFEGLYTLGEGNTAIPAVAKSY